jgi:hypothetical protein
LDIVVVKWRKYIAVYVLFILLPTLIESIENISVEDDSDQPDLQLSLTSNKDMDRFRDLIVEHMWNDYQEYIRKE